MERSGGTRFRGVRSIALLTLWMTACAAAIAGLWSIDGPAPELPPGSRSAVSDWVANGDALDTVAALGRVAATIALGYLLVVAVLHVVVCAWGTADLRLRVARLNPAPVATLVALAVTGVGPAAAGASPGPRHGPAIQPGEDTTMMVVEDDTPSMVLREAPDEPTTASTTAVPTTQAPTTQVPTVSPTAPPPAPQPGAAPRSIVVQPGDHLWGIAESRVALALGDQAGEADVRSYWMALIEANADRFVEPGNADLIVPGQDLVLPG